jgi:hypothetical protein
MATRWSDLSESSRRLIIGAAVGEAVLKTAVLIDIRRRPASQIRGSKRMWIIAAVLVNSAGVGPLSYFAFGRRRHEAGRGIGLLPAVATDRSEEKKSGWIRPGRCCGAGNDAPLQPPDSCLSGGAACRGG